MYLARCYLVFSIFALFVNMYHVNRTLIASSIGRDMNDNELRCRVRLSNKVVTVIEEIRKADTV